ncbi:MAG: hypothetical protein KAX25_01915 [Dehalococcoidia bacterium]|nr:hypothetical protein [Dehalococcoidia bacterium]
MENPVRLIIIGLVLVLCGAILPFMMVIGVLPKTFVASALAYACSIAGAVTGLVGMVAYRRRPK